MSSWLTFHLMGLYPNAGHSYYLINSPLLKQTVFNFEDGKKFRIVARNLSARNRYIKSAMLNGNPFNQAWIEHADIVAGGELILEMAEKPSGWGQSPMP